MSRMPLILLAAIALAAGCGPSGETPDVSATTSGGGGVSASSMTQNEALARVTELAKQTTDAIDPKPELDLYRPSLNPRYCDPDSDAPDAPIHVYRAYYLRGVPETRLKDVADQVRRFWERQGYVIVTASENGLNFTARSRADGFNLAIGRAGGEVLTLEIESPCIVPDETPGP